MGWWLGLDIQGCRFFLSLKAIEDLKAFRQNLAGCHRISVLIKCRLSSKTGLHWKIPDSLDSSKQMPTIWLRHTGYIGRQSKFQFVFGLQPYTKKCVASLLSTGGALMWDGGRGHGQLRLKFFPEEICRGLGIILPSHSHLCSASEGIQPAPFTISARAADTALELAKLQARYTALLLSFRDIWQRFRDVTVCCLLNLDAHDRPRLMVSFKSGAEYQRWLWKFQEM